jgi:hypothetical protein
VRFWIGFSALLLALTTNAANAGPAEDKIAQRISEPYPGYNKQCGFPILFQPVRSISLARIDRRLGPIIVLDPLLAYPGQEAHRRFLIAHECAHHRLKHTSLRGLRERIIRPNGVEDQELSADCWAAEALTAADMDGDARSIVDMFYRKGLHSPGSGYPSGVQRSTMIYHCLRSAQRRRIASKRAE